MGFRTTQWGLFDALKQDSAQTRQESLAKLVAIYAPPLFALARYRSGGSLTHEDCEDLVNDFLLECLAGELLSKEEAVKPNEKFKRSEPIKRKELFMRADPTKGKFRNFIAKSFERYMQNRDRERKAGKRNPGHGLLSLQSLIEEYGPAIEPRNDETPEGVFERVFQRSIFENTLKEFERRCKAAGQEKKYKLYFLREVQPLRDGCEVPTYASLAAKLDITSENSANKMLLAAREEFRDLLLNGIGNDCVSQKETEIEYEMVISNVLSH